MEKMSLETKEDAINLVKNLFFRAWEVLYVHPDDQDTETNTKS